MKYFILLIFFNIASAANQLYSVSFEFDKLVQNIFKNDKFASEAVQRLYYYKKMKQLNLNDDKKWESFQINYWKSLYCVHFLVGSALTDTRIQELDKKFQLVEKMNDYEKNDINKLLDNRDLRRRTYDQFKNIELKDKYKLCPFNLDPSFINKKQKELEIESNKIKKTLDDITK